MLRHILQAIQDYQLIGIVCAMIAIVVCILIFWDVISPQQLKRLSSEVSYVFITFELVTGYEDYSAKLLDAKVIERPN